MLPDVIVKHGYAHLIDGKIRVAHAGDCRVWDVKVCTCGLLHCLAPFQDPQAIYRHYSLEA